MAGGQGTPHLVCLAEGHGGVKESGFDAMLAQVVHLVLHQRYEGSHNQGDASEHKARYLECDGLAGAGGKQSQGVVSGQHGVYYLALHGAERVVAPIFSEYVKRVR